MRICVIGGGAAGMMAACKLAEGGMDVTLLERNEKLGKKLYITGKGRCNLTNDCSRDELFSNITRGGKFLQSALGMFSPKDTMAFFEDRGLPLTVERGNRVFPSSGKSSDVIKTLNTQLKLLNVTIKTSTFVKYVKKSEDGFEVGYSENDNIVSERFGCVVVATGGVSYPSTGSTGDGYEFAKAFGHEIVQPKPSLVALVAADNVKMLSGVTLKNVRLSAICDGKKYSEFGEMTFTDCGISGPIVLTMSSYLARTDLKNKAVFLDLKPALDYKTLEFRLLRDFEERKNMPICSAIRGLLIDKVNLFVLQRVGVDKNKRVNMLTKEERTRILMTIKSLAIMLNGAAPFSEAIITAGGVQLDGLKPTLESKFASGLYFVGEVIDADALTGGFNLQIAWATAARAAEDILKKYPQAAE